MLLQDENNYPHNGVRRFESKHAAFGLPTNKDEGSADQDNPVHPMRRMYVTAHGIYLFRVTPSWLPIVHESMVNWVGCGMPRLMIVSWKPTSMGLKHHTVRCAATVILVNV
eukprot:5956385-Pleurochrysis_carterae.AAC.1